MALRVTKTLDVALTGTNDGTSNWRAEIVCVGEDLEIGFFWGDKPDPNHVGLLTRSDLLELLSVKPSDPAAE